MLTTVAEEKRFNARLGADKSEADFVGIMNGLELAHPKLMDEAVPANLRSGIAVPGASEETLTLVADAMDALGRQDSAEFHQGGGI